jgi:hypothetical protein
MDVRGNVVGFTEGVRNMSLLQSIQKVIVGHPDPYLVGIRDFVSGVKRSGREAEHSYIYKVKKYL